MTYYLQGKVGKVPIIPPPISPILGLSKMETLAEEDESRDSATPKSEDRTVIVCNASEEETFNGDGTQNQPLITVDKAMDDGAENSMLINHCDA